MLADPQSITFNSVVTSMPRIATNGMSSRYQSSDGNLILEISHTIKKGRVRTLTKLTQRKQVTDPLTQITDYDTATEQIIQDRPEYGWTPTEIGYVWSALRGFVTDAVLLKLVELQH
jgi:hypothetical protein